MTNAKKYKTTQEKIKAFTEYAKNTLHYSDTTINVCTKVFNWLEETTKEYIAPCPFCGGKTECCKEWNDMYRVVCKEPSCWYSACLKNTEKEAIEEHNRVAENNNSNLKNQNITDEKKYELTDETIEIDGHTLHRIRAVRDFVNIHKGDLGGWIESEKNLSHELYCWVFDNAYVYGNAKVGGDAWVFGNARVYGNAKVGGDAWVLGNARVYGNACVRGNTCVCGDARINGNAIINYGLYNKGEN